MENPSKFFLTPFGLLVPENLVPMAFAGATFTLGDTNHDPSDPQQ